MDSTCKQAIVQHIAYTPDDWHRTGTTEIVQAIKSVEDRKEMTIWNQTMYL